MKPMLIALSLLSTSAQAGTVSERPYCQPTNATEIFVTERLELPTCTTLYLDETTKNLLLGMAESSARGRCQNGALEILGTPNFRTRPSCWTIGPSVFSVDVTFKCEPI